MKKFIAVIVMILLCVCLVGCSSITTMEVSKTVDVSEQLVSNQATPTDIDFSLERYNLIRRAYWVNGQREKANNLICEVQKPLGYIVLFAGNTPVERFVVDGKVSSLNSFLTPSEYPRGSGTPIEIPDVDGSYGVNDEGIFFFTVSGNYVEWTGDYMYSDIPIEIANPILMYREIE